MRSSILAIRHSWLLKTICWVKRRRQIKPLYALGRDGPVHSVSADSLLARHCWYPVVGAPSFVFGPIDVRLFRPKLRLIWPGNYLIWIAAFCAIFSSTFLLLYASRLYILFCPKSYKTYPMFSKAGPHFVWEHFQKHTTFCHSAMIVILILIIEWLDIYDDLILRGVIKKSNFN